MPPCWQPTNNVPSFGSRFIDVLSYVGRHRFQHVPSSFRNCGEKTKQLVEPNQRKRFRPAQTFAVLPTALTLGNAVCGLGSIAMVANLFGQEGIDQRMFIAALLIFLAMVFDLLDGAVARKMNQTSRFGEELDSLCDAISFGVAPAFVVLMNSSNLFHPRFLWVVSVTYVLCVLVRLARYNAATEEETSKDFFSGLPSPAAAALIASYALSIPSLMQLSAHGISQWRRTVGERLTIAADLSLPFMALAVAFLMVSPIRYPHFNYLIRGKKEFHHVVKLIIAIAAVATVHELAVPFICTYYVVASPLVAVWLGAIKERERLPQIRPKRFVDWAGHRRTHIRKDRRPFVRRKKQRLPIESKSTGDPDGRQNDTFA